jgi:hypothetical protein
VRILGSANGLKGRYSIADDADLPTTSLSVSGTVRCDPILSPDLIFLKETGQEGFVGATDLVADGTSDHEKVYKWQLALSTQFLPHRDEELEFWVYNNPTKAFLKVTSYYDDKFISDLPANWQATNSGECVFDTINGKPFTNQPIHVDGFLLIQGWAAVAPENGVAADEVFVGLAGDDGTLRVAKVETFPRTDVNAYFKHAEMGPTGFRVLLCSSSINVSSKLQIYLKRNNRLFACRATVLIRR